MIPDHDPYLEEYRALGEQLQALPIDDSTVASVVTHLNRCLKDAQELAIHPDTPEEKRSYWCGGTQVLTDAIRDLTAFLDGSWKQSPEYARALSQARENQEEDEEEG